ncbi:MAG: pyridoxamine 5'-phosphate oxidase family protein [Chloroflexi bacterium]|nr:pyridoxamine 5'-phosphate oxidase family protein [Chloroflexota bacterium]
MTQGTKEKILAYMQEHNTLTLSTYGEGMPWAASVFFANDDLVLYFLSDPRTQHGRHLASNPKVAATINEDYRDWRKIKGIQLEGKAEIVTSRKEKAKGFAVYVRKFPFVAEFFSSPAKLALAMFSKISSTTLYKITPSRILFLDNEQGFGYREELIIERTVD